MSNILVAEDEKNIAIALGAVLKKGIKDVTVKIVHDGDQAVEELSKSKFDLILSDWNMPKMTGVELLAKVRSVDTLKNIPFLMLTARGDKGSVVTALKSGVTEYIAKPFDNKILIEKVLSLLEKNNADKNVQEQSISNYLYQRLKNNDIEIPVMPEVALRAAELSKSDDVSFEELSGLISKDAALSSKIINVANSPHYRAGHFDSIEDAITRIGLHDVSNLIVVISNKNMFSKASGFYEAKLTKLWEHSFATATCAKLISQKIGLANPDNVFTMGLLHDIGKLVLLTALFKLSQHRTIDEQQVDDIIKLLHVKFGEVVVSAWNMPMSIMNVITHHHDLEIMDKLPIETKIVSFANILVRRIGYSLVSEEDSSSDDNNIASLLKLDNSKINKILEETEHYIKSMKTAV